MTNAIKYPKDNISRVICTEARKIFPKKLNSAYWEHHELTGTDHGTDMIIEYIEDEQFKNYRIECQIKGTTILDKMTTKYGISYALDIKTINYALSCKSAFLFILVDINTETVYYLPLQDYFIADREYYYKMNNNKENFTVHISKDSIITSENDFELQELAKSTYIRNTKTNKILKIND